ncbi:hypothetical protein [Natronolimnobius baerhuensis]|uniref:hypothetical protein n=1 Tax=Natronolimnobius baerhuensis TaxID=253108 RepID=UPI001595792B|nr:hypothetical protein [Natronolimnobius baerhuensis]
MAVTLMIVLSALARGNAERNMLEEGSKRNTFEENSRVLEALTGLASVACVR